MTLNTQPADIHSYSREHFRQIGSENQTSVYAIHADKDQPDGTRTGSPSNRMQSHFNDDLRKIRDLDETKIKGQIHHQESEDKGYYERSTPNYSEEDDLRNPIELEMARSTALAALSHHSQSALSNRFNIGKMSYQRNVTAQIESHDHRVEPRQCDSCLHRRAVEMTSPSQERFNQNKTFHSIPLTLGTTQAFSPKQSLARGTSSYDGVVDPHVPSTKNAASKRSEMLLRSRSMPGACDNAVDRGVSSFDSQDTSLPSETTTDGRRNTQRTRKTVETQVRYSRTCPVHNAVVQSDLQTYNSASGSDRKLQQQKIPRVASIDYSQQQQHT